ncbi:MAG: PAS domain S-box protein [Lentisphaerae bacterium]|nr:PAS domain S-box protein [Lentisphaerota bacterium]
MHAKGAGSHNGEPLKPGADRELERRAAAMPASMLEAEGVFLSALMTNIPDSIYFKDRQSRFLMVNRALADKFGLDDMGEAVGKSDADFFLPEHAREARLDEMKIIETGIPVVAKEEHEIMPDGSSRWVSTTKLPLYDRAGEIIGTFGISRDVTEHRLAEDSLRRSEEQLRIHRDTLEERVRDRTLELQQINTQLQGEVQERRRAETALRLSEERYRQLLATTPTYVYTVHFKDGAAVSTQHGSGCVAVTGYSAEEYTQSPQLWIAMIPPEDRDMVLGLLEADLSSDKRRPIEHRIIHKNGSIRWVRNTIVPHRNARGELVHYDGLVEDITDRKMAEDGLREGERLRTISQLSGGVAHSFNAVTGVVAGIASSIADSVLPGTAAHRDAQKIIQAMSHASDLTRRLLGMAGACETEGIRVEDAISLNQAVKDTAELVENQYIGRNVRMTLQLAEEDVMVRAASSQLLEVLLSLYSNAAEAMPDGGTVTVRTKRRNICRPSRWNPRAREGAYAVLYVSDTGVGMDSSIRDKVFEPFFTSGKGETSFGLGLTIARNTVEAWGGWIDFRSVPGKGSIFRVFLPASAHVAKSEPEADVVVAKGTTVLLVDDDPEATATMQGVLEAAGFRVLAASTSRDGTAMYYSHRDTIAVSVIDLVMTDGDGRLIVENIITDHPKAKVIVVSGFSRDYVRHCLNLGTWSFLQKPFEANSLVDAVKAAIGGRKRRRPVVK